jgi:hypothetical protein
MSKALRGSVLLLLLSAPNLVGAQQQAAASSLHGTVNIVLANADGIVVLTDSMLTDENRHQLPRPGQKLFVLDNKSVCTIAGLYERAGAFKELNLSTRSKIYAYASALKTAKRLTLQQELDGLVFHAPG